MESAVINLKIELEKRRAIANAQKLETKQDKSKEKLLNVKHSKEKLTIKVPLADKDIEDHKMLEKSRSMLRKKTEIYNQIKNGTDVLESDELNEKFLINFQKKSEESASEEKKSKFDVDGDDDKYWVEYIDPLGRTRKCLKEDFEYMKQRDRKMMPERVESNLEDVKTVKLHEKWNKVEEESKAKKNLHYQDVLFDEAREHGVGYMPFSRDEAERTTQRDMLNKLREETKKAELSNKKSHKEANKRMADRLTKVRQRKRLKLGLPIKNICEEKLATPPSSDDETVVEPLQEIEPPSSSIPPKVKPIREWDVGKTTPVMDQKQWVESRRKLRQNEFAPPQSY